MTTWQIKLSIKYFFIFFSLFYITSVDATRIKDIATIAGVRDNQLVGYGLVVGLDGTGDRPGQAPFTEQSFQNMLLQFGIHIPAGKNMQLRNVAAVAISATLPPFAKIGQRLDVTVSSIGNASSLRSGNLLMAPLHGADGQVYGMAQGSVIVSGFGASGADGSRIMVNSTGSGNIPNGATVEKMINSPFVQNGHIILELSRPDFNTAGRVEKLVNQTFGRKVAQALDAGSIRVNVASLAGVDYLDGEQTSEVMLAARSKYVRLISRIQDMTLRLEEPAARVTVNSRTGTIVIGNNVTIQPVAVAHGNLSVVVTEQPFVSQPAPFAKRGDTVAGSSSNVAVSQQPGRAFVLAPGPSLNDLVEAINRAGAAPGDLIAILEAIKAAGALNADLDVI